MMKALALLLLASLLLAQAPAPQMTRAPSAGDAVRFGALDVFLDSGTQPLAAYQFELKVTSGDVKLVGVEGGEHAAFKRPPYYDPRALAGERIVIAALDTGVDLPRGRTRVARLMVQVRGPVTPTYAATVVVAGSPQAKSIPATISISDTPASEGAKR